MDDPVLFLEHKGLYRQNYASANEPDTNTFLEFGKGRYISLVMILQLSHGVLLCKNL